MYNYEKQNLEGNGVLCGRDLFQHWSTIVYIRKSFESLVFT